jgi:hypothetical protein
LYYSGLDRQLKGLGGGVEAERKILSLEGFGYFISHFIVISGTNRAEP